MYIVIVKAFLKTLFGCFFLYSGEKNLVLIWINKWPVDWEVKPIHLYKKNQNASQLKLICT